jgi:HAD superfamily hydrolase (TIGR01509 family)
MAKTTIVPLPTRARLVIFDCDGVLVDSEWLANRVVARELEPFGVECTMLDLARRFTGRTTPEMLSALAGEAGVTLPHGFADSVEQSIDLALRAEAEGIIGVKELLERLKGPRGIASNSSGERVRASLVRAGLEMHFETSAIFSADMVAKPKPAPDVYRLAFEELGGRDNDTIAVEDSVAGATAARLAGLPVIGFSGGSHIPPGHDEALTAAGATCVVNSHMELSALFAELSLLR